MTIDVMGQKGFTVSPREKVNFSDLNQMGVEMELQLFNSQGSPVSAQEVIRMNSKHVDSELLDNMLEVKTSPVSVVKVDKLISELEVTLENLAQVAGEQDARVLMDSTPPLPLGEDPINRNSSFIDWILKEYEGYGESSLFLALGTQIHVQIPDGEFAIFVHNAYRVIRHLIRAVTNNSPFLLGKFMVCTSARDMVRRSVGNSWIPPKESSYSDFLEETRHLYGNRMIPTARKANASGLRLDKGTYEFSDIDNPHSLQEFREIVLFHVALINNLLRVYKRREQLPPLFSLSENEILANNRQVDRFGTCAQVIPEHRADAVSIEEPLKQLTTWLISPFLMNLLRNKSPGERKIEQFVDSFCIYYCPAREARKILNEYESTGRLKCSGECNKKDLKDARVQTIEKIVL